MRSPRKNALIVGAALVGLIALVYITIIFILQSDFALLQNIYAQQITAPFLLAALLVVAIIFGAALALVRRILARSSNEIAAHQAIGEHLKHRIDTLQVLSKIEQALNSELMLPEQINLLLDFTLAHLRTDFAAVSMLDPGAGVLNPVAVRGLNDPESYLRRPIQVGEGAAGWIAQHGKPLVLPNVLLDVRWSQTRLADQERFISYLGVPLQIESRMIGVLDVMTRAPREFPPEEIEFITALAMRAAIAIQNARLYEQTQQRAVELEALRQASLSLTSSLDLDAVLNAVLENILRLTHKAQNAHIYFYQDNVLTFGAALWSDGHKGQQWAEPRGNGLTYTVARQGTMIVAPDMAQHPLFANERWKGAIIGLPIKSEERVLGVMNIAYAAPHTFDEAELRALQLFADQAAIAIDNARLHKAVQKSETRYRTLLENIPIGVYRVTPGPTGKFLMANPAHLAMFGFESLAELQQINVSDLYVDPSQRQVFSDQVMEQGHISGFEQQLKKKDGTPIWVLVTAQAVYENNQTAYIDCTSIDITARKRETLARAFAEDNLRQRTRELEAMLEVSSSSTHLDMETVLTVVAHRARNLLEATEATLFLMDENENLLRPIVALGEYTAERLGLLLHPGEGVVGWVAQHREALSIDHTLTDGRVRHVPGTPEEDESMLCAPLVHGTHLQGVIMLNRIPPIGFTRSELELLVGLADQASGAIANARLYEETRRNALEQKIVSEISQSLNSTLDVYQTFPIVVKGIRALADCDRISLALLDADNQHFTMVMLDEPRPELSQGTRLPLSSTACAADILGRRAHITPDLSTEIAYAAERLLDQAGYRSRVNLPLIVGESSIGSLNLVSRRLGGFNHSPLAPLQQIANTIAIALKNTQLFQAEQTRREELASLYSLSRQLADQSNSESILRLVAQHIVDTIHVTFARILVYEDNEYVVRAAYPIRIIAHDLQVGQRGPLEELSFLKEILRESAPVVMHPDDPRLGAAKAQTLFLGFEQTLCLVPLIVNERAIGLLILGEERSEMRATFSPDKVHLARNIGDQAASALHRVELFEELESAYLQTVFALANAVDAKDSDTSLHSHRLAELALLVGKKMGLSPHLLEDLRFGAILHDIGKIGVPDAVLKKPAQLDLAEWAQMHQHPVIGEHIIAPLPRLANAAKIVRHHHERYDGGGYPDHLAQEEIPIGARILTVVDAYGAIMDKRVYKEGRSHEQAIAEIRQCAGTQFDPRIVDVFLQVIAERNNVEQAP